MLPDFFLQCHAAKQIGHACFNAQGGIAVGGVCSDMMSL